MRLDRALAPTVLATLVAGLCVGEAPAALPPAPAPAPDVAVVAFREQRLEWTDDQVAQVVITSPLWREAVPVPVLATAPTIAPRGDGAPSAVLATGIPETAMASYTGAADSVAGSDPSCGLPWSVLAAIGRVESNHGRYGGAMLHSDGSIRPVIRGIALDGRPGVAVIGDSDGGGLDGDRAYDRAVGPMQFIPSTWQAWAADGNGDGVRDPDNMFDAALAAGRYLCAGDVDTRTPEGLRSSIFRYNHSDDYVSAVVSIASAYRDNENPVIPDPATTSEPATTVPAPTTESAAIEPSVTVPATTEEPVTSTTAPPLPTEEAPSTPPSTTDSTRPSRPDICAILPDTGTALPWPPAMPVFTCEPQPPIPTPEVTPTPSP